MGQPALWWGSIPLREQQPSTAPRGGDTAGKPKEQDTDQVRRAEAQRCRRRGKTRKEVADFDFEISTYPATPGAGATLSPRAQGLAPTLMPEVFQARLRHRRSCLCFQNCLGFLPTACPTSTWCQTLEKKSLERMKRE